LGISGGVSANDRLWEYANGLIKHKNYINQNFALVKPTKKVYSTDNAAMIGAAGILHCQHML
jgi:tRNA A37 threonylcarbamoyltransferase TsaD